MAGINKLGATVLLVWFIAVGGWGSTALVAADAPLPDCMSALITLQSCLNFVTGKAAAPSSDCCSGVTNIHLTNPACLCVLTEDDNTTKMIPNYNLNQAGQLPSLCNVQGASISNCPAYLGQANVTPLASGNVTSPASVPGFLSIDCGYNGASYNDSHGLTWVADDETFILTGETAKQSYNSSSLDFADSVHFIPHIALESGPFLQTFRYFPEPRNKHCYKLTTTASVTYLIRANFYLNRSVFNQRRPFQFSMFINANNWFTITSGDDSPHEFHVTEEAIFHSQGNTTYFCLQPAVGVPFISSLELRPLEANMYSYFGSQKQYLVLLCRNNLGAKSTLSVRFPDDNFDRIWYTVQGDYVDAIPKVSTPTPPDNTSRADVYYVPPTVMKDGWNLNSPYIFNFDLSSYVYASTGDQVSMTPAENAFAVLYTEYLNISDLQTYSVDVYLDNEVASPVSFSHNASMQKYPNFILSSNNLNVAFKDLNLTEGPTLNAIEVYGQVNYNFSQTDPKDVHAIEDLKTSLSLTDWQGDPCSPVPHDWLSCTQTSSFFISIDPIQQPCGSNATVVKECPVQQASYFLNGTYSVAALNFSYLATNDLSLFTNASGKSSGTYLQNLAEMRLTNSGVDSQKFGLLIENFLSSLWMSIWLLDLSYNSIDSMPGASGWGALGLGSLNLSHNALNDTTLLSFQYLPDFGAGYLEILDLSYNVISFLPSTWINTTYVLISLDLSHNLLQGQISNLDQLIGINNVTLQTIDVSYNKLMGKFSSSLYFSSLPSLTIANFADNLIGGTLDLNAWYNVLQNASQNASFVDTLPLFSFVNNSISDIIPSADTFERVMRTLMENQTFHRSGILLGGNPYCKGAKAYIQQYFCRFSVDDKVPRDQNHKKDILIISITSGIVAFILLFAILATLWKLWKQVYELREIQQALANRKVQPPFYQYNDLKFATRDFHNDSKLGHGGFGVVYKGILADKTTLAVKKLFNSEGLQEIDEFLNEVVLLTGIKHKNLVQLKGCCIKDKQRMLIYEYVENGNLAEALWGSRSKVHGALSWEQRFNICVGVARGLSYLHEELQPSIIHRDIKPENVLLDRNFRPKIADFGLARQFEESNQARYTQVAGTLGYFSPEYASEGQLSSKADVYSFGILVLEVVSGRKCIDPSLHFEAKFLKDWVRKMHKKGLVFDILQPKLRENCDEAQVLRAISIGLLCLQHDPERRPSMSTVVTMFLGRADVEVFLDESDYVHSDFNTLLLTIDQLGEFENPTLHSIVEKDSPNFHLIDLNLESSSSIPPTSTRSSRSQVELCTIGGR